MFIFSGIQTGSDEQSRVDSHHKMIVALIVPCSALGAIILFLLCFWLYHLKFTHKSSNKNAKNPGTFFFVQIIFSIIFLRFADLGSVLCSGFAGLYMEMLRMELYYLHFWANSIL